MSILRTMCSIRNRTACSGEPDELSIMKISMIWWRDFWKNTAGERRKSERKSFAWRLWRNASRPI